MQEQEQEQEPHRVAQEVWKEKEQGEDAGPREGAQQGGRGQGQGQEQGQAGVEPSKSLLLSHGQSAHSERKRSVTSPLTSQQFTHAVEHNLLSAQVGWRGPTFNTRGSPFLTPFSTLLIIQLNKLEGVASSC